MKKWKLLFWFVFTVELISLIRLPFSESIGLLDIFGLVFGGISLMPMYGFSYQIPIGNRLISKLIFFGNACFLSLPFSLSIVAFIGNPSIAQFVFSTLAMALALTVMYPLFMYAFRSDCLWTTNTV